MIIANKYKFIGLLTLAVSSAYRPAGAATLYFQSNFENPITIANRSGDSTWAQDLVGEDGTLSGKDNWQTSLEHDTNPSVGIDGSWLGNGYINVINNLTKNRPILVADPTNTANRVLKYEVFDCSETFDDPELSKGRVQLELNNNKLWREFYYAVNVYLPSSTLNRIRYNMPGSWGSNKSWFFLNGMSHKNGTNANPSLLRRSSLYLNIKRDLPGSPFRWTMGARDTQSDGQNGAWRNQWSRTNATVDVPVDTWFKLEFYLKEGGNANEGANAGRVYAAIVVGGTKHVLFNITGPTRDLNPDNAKAGYSGVSPLKLYVNKPIIDAVNSDPVNAPNPVSVYWDNFRLYYGTYPWYMGTATYEGGKSGEVDTIPWVSSGPYLDAPNGSSTSGELDYRN